MFPAILSDVKTVSVWAQGVLAIGAVLLAVTPARAQTPEVKRPSRQAIPSAQQAEMAQLAANAMAALRRGDSAGAIQGFEKLTKLAPGVAEFHANLGMAYYSAGRFRDAIPPCRQALKLKPSLTATRYFLGLSLAESGQCGEARVESSE